MSSGFNATSIRLFPSFPIHSPEGQSSAARQAGIWPSRALIHSGSTDAPNGRAQHIDEHQRRAARIASTKGGNGLHGVLVREDHARDGHHV